MLSFLIFALAAIDPAFSALRHQDERLQTIAWRLQTANVALCPTISPLTGMSLEALSLYPKDLRATAKAQLGLGDRVAVAAVARGSAAHSAGLVVGDAILVIGAAETPKIDTEASGYADVARVEAQLEGALRAGATVLRIQQQGATRIIRLRGVNGCASIVQIIPGRRLNAQADGRYVQINAAIFDLAHTDDELAAIVAHELAHNILQHRAKRTASKQAEYEADWLSVWLVARSGYDVDVVVPFWTRLEQRTNLGIFADGSHPAPGRRLAALARAVAVVKAQRASGQDLVPPAQ